MINAQMMPSILPMVGGFSPSTPLGTFVEDQGGYFIGTAVDPDDGDGGKTYALFLAAKAAGQNNAVQWKIARSNTAGTDSLTNGLSNSNAMNNGSHPAAQFCRALTLAGFNDWYFPAKDELNVIYTNRSAIVGVDAIDANEYWSSSQSAAASAWRQDFSSGSQYTGVKDYATRARAIRRLAI